MAQIAYYKLDTDAIDYSSNSRNGTNNGATFVTNGQVNGGADFETSESDWIDTNTLFTELEDNKAFSVSFWIKPETIIGQAILSNLIPDATLRGFEIRIEPAGTIQIFFMNDFPTTFLQITTTPTISAGVFSHIMFTSDGTGASNMKFYINNVLVSSNIDVNTLSGTTVSTSNLTIGRRPSSTSFFDGIIDEVRVFNTELTSEERSNIFAFTGLNEVLIDGTDYSLRFVDLNTDDKSIYQAGSFELLLDDTDNSIDPVIERYEEIILSESGTKIFTGVIVDIDNGEDDSSSR